MGILYKSFMGLRLLFSAQDIAIKVRQLGEEISLSYNRDSGVVAVGILKGCFMFMADLARHIDVPLEIDFARLASYGDSDTPESEVRIIKDIEIDARGKDVLIIDDIMDTGKTHAAFKRHLMSKGVKSVKICTLIDKLQRRQVQITPDYFGFRVEDGFIVGYGLDHAERYRNLPELYVMETLSREDEDR